MKKFLIVAALCVLAGVVLFYFYPTQRTAPPTENPSGSDSSNGKNPSFAPAHRPAVSSVSNGAVAGTAASATASSAQPQDLSARAGEYIPRTNVSSNLSPETMLQDVRRVVHQYDSMFGGNPVGTNPEITAMLTGQNPKKINFLGEQDGMRVNDKGELVDLWGTPYFFHQLSATDMEIHSAGPDKIMWTLDDLVTR